MLFFSFFKTLVNHEVTVELKNDISIRGKLKSVDQFLNIKLDDISVVDDISYPHLVSSAGQNMFRLLSTAHAKLALAQDFSERNGIELVTDRSMSQSSVKNVFIRGSVVRYVHLPAAAVDTPLLEDATRRGA